MRSWRSFRQLFCALALAALAPLPALAAPTLDEALTRIEQQAPIAMRTQGAPGMALAITDRTHTLHIFTFGYANVDGKIPVTEQTRFGIGSITKSMTATALLEARDEGRFNPQTPVTSYLPWFSVHSKYRAITGHDLLTHSSGLPDGALASGLASIISLRDWSTGYAPGTHWSYSNVGYQTLGAILEAIDGSDDYPSIIRRRVFTPLDMNATTAVWSPLDFADVATGYLYRSDDTADPETPVLMVSATTHFVDPAGSVISTPADMASYMRYILNQGSGPHGRLISQASWHMFTTQAQTNGRPLGDAAPGAYHRYAYGLFVQDQDGDNIVGHTGGVLSYTACMQIDLSSGFGVIALTNLAYVGPRPCAIDRYALAVLRAYAHGQALPDAPAPADPRHVENAAAYAGTYRGVVLGLAFTIIADGDRLMLQRPGANAPLYSRGKDVFWVDDPAFATHLLEFGRNSSGNVVEAFYGPDWFTTGAYRGPLTFPYPRAWNGLAGHYRSIDANGYFFSYRIWIRKNHLLADGEQLTPLGANMFRVGADAWSPERLLFDEFVNGSAQRIRSPGGELYRTSEP